MQIDRISNGGFPANSSAVQHGQIFGYLQDLLGPLNVRSLFYCFGRNTQLFALIAKNHINRWLARYIQAMNPQKRAEMFRRFKDANPDPQTELRYDSPFELLIAVILSAQATDVSVNKATAKLFPIANTPEALVDLGEEGIKPYIKTIGLFNTKTKSVFKTCKILCEEHQGIVPEDREALEALPGVGRKTANVVLNTAFRHYTMAVDTHIYRVSNRTGLAPGKTVLAVEKKLMRYVPKEYLLDAHHWLILHGRYVCLARTPKCPDCLVSDLCDFRGKTPAKSEKTTKKKAKRVTKR